MLRGHETGKSSRYMHMHVYAEKTTPCKPSVWSFPREKKSPCHGSCGTHADESIPGVATRHLIGQGGEDPPARCGPRVPDSDRTSIHVDPLPVHRVGGGTLPALLPGRGVGQHLGRERFVDLDQIDVPESQTCAVEQARYRDG